MRVHLKIKRFDPESGERPHWEKYDVEAEPTDLVLDVLNDIKWHQDGTLTFRRSCGHGICGSDAMMINGVNRLACKTLVQDVGAHIQIEPLRGLNVVKDLVVDMDPFFDAYKSVKPHLINDEECACKERLQSPEEREKFDDGTKCILCASCTTSCPSFWANDHAYIGPAAIVNAHRFIFDSRDRGSDERFELLDTNSGVWRCRYVYNCTKACPRDIDVGNLIQQVRNAIVTRKLVKRSPNAEKLERK